MKKPDPCSAPICIKDNSKFKFGKVADFFASKLYKKETKTPKDYLNCPEDKQSLGNCSWRLLHTTAIYFPENPSSDD